VNVIIRADAGPQIGTGHVMRCLALAQALQDSGVKATFSVAEKFPWLESLLGKEGVEAVRMLAKPGSSEDAIQTAKLARKEGCDWVIVDGYHFGAGYQSIIKTNGLRLLFLDDIGHADHYSADIVLNQNVNACETLYKSRENYTRLMLGTQYALLRRDFRELQGWHREIADVADKILVTLGGSDPKNNTFKVIECLNLVEVDELEINVIVGANNPHLKTLQSAAMSSRLTIRIDENVAKMPSRMAWADMAISAGGTTCLELAFMGLPTCIVVIAENQSFNAQTLHDQGLMINLGPPSLIDEERAAQIIGNLIKDKERRRKMSRSASRMVNGLGAKKVVEQLLEY
jgi:UDP-2,4-diacetamido-2,4,6-trideoxy-beta-L-altropyranose hydrolase